MTLFVISFLLGVQQFEKIRTNGRAGEEKDYQVGEKFCFYIIYILFHIDILFVSRYYFSKSRIKQATY